MRDRRAGSLRVEHLLSPTRRDLAQLDLAFYQDVQAPARLSFREEHLPFPQDALRAMPEKPAPLGRREQTEVGRPSERVSPERIAGRATTFAVAGPRLPLVLVAMARPYHR